MLIRNRHGKDNKLIVWKYSPSDEEGVSKVLPVDGVDVERVKPWVLYVLEVNTLNFCSFGSCKAQNLLGSSVGDVEESSSMEVVKKEDDGYNDLLIAVPNTLKGENVSGANQEKEGKANGNRSTSSIYLPVTVSRPSLGRKTQTPAWSWLSPCSTFHHQTHLNLLASP